jgi:hypothetical protein
LVVRLENVDTSLRQLADLENPVDVVVQGVRYPSVPLLTEAEIYAKRIELLKVKVTLLDAMGLVMEAQSLSDLLDSWGVK